MEVQPEVGLPPLEHGQVRLLGRQVVVLAQVVWAPLEVGQAVAWLVPQVLVCLVAVGRRVVPGLEVPLVHLVAPVWQRWSRWCQGQHVGCW